MLNVRKFIPVMVFAMSVAPLAAHARRSDMPRPQPAQYVMLTSAANQTVSRFPEGRASLRMTAQPDATVFITNSQYAAANITSSRTANNSD
jgi:hypothetical protein